MKRLSNLKRTKAVILEQTECRVLRQSGQRKEEGKKRELSALAQDCGDSPEGAAGSRAHLANPQRPRGSGDSGPEQAEERAVSPFGCLASQEPVQPSHTQRGVGGQWESRFICSRGD